MKPDRLVGITVLPEYIQSESIDEVLDRLLDVGATAVATSPYVMEEADEATGSREPPADAGAGSVRLLDRPLWGKRELWVRTAPSFVPTSAFYEGLRYQPPSPSELTYRQGPIIAHFLRAARERGLRVYLQVQAAIPPGYRVQFGGPVDEDCPLLPDGRRPGRRVANNGSLASPHICAYQRALIGDLCRHYPEIDAIRFDWPEYPPYLLDSAFLDFSSHAQHAAERLGYDFTAMQRDAASLYRKLHGGLTDADLHHWLEEDGGRFALLQTLRDYPGVAQLWQFKASLCEQLLQGFRQALDEAGGRHIAVEPSAFPPPWSIVSGMDYRRAARYCPAISVKLYGMHWAMMLRFYGEQLLQANCQLSEPLLVRALVRLLDIADDQGFSRLDDYHYPGPDEPHPAGQQAQRRKIAQAQASAGEAAIHVLAHGYGPLADFRRRLEIACQASSHGLWVNRYGYLSDQKLATLKRSVKGEE